jgi:hypothetical protein
MTNDPTGRMLRGAAQRTWVRAVLMCALVTLLAGGAFVAVHQARASSATLNVCLASGCAYHSINDALAQANAGDTISVAPGTYTPGSETAAGAAAPDTTVAINKAITLRGAGQGKTILNDASFYNGTAADSGIVQIHNPGGDVTVSGFTFEGAITNDSNSCCDDGMFISLTDNHAADTITVVNNTFYSDTTIDPQLLGDQNDSIYMYDGTATVNVIHNTFQGVFRATLAEGYLGPINIKQNDINGLHGLYDISTSPPTLYFWAEAIFFLVDNNADVTAPQVIRGNTFENYSGEGVAVDAGYPGGLVGAMHNLTIDSNVFNNGGIAGVVTPDSPDIFLHAFGYSSGSLVSEISGVTIKNNTINLGSNTGQGTGIWLRGAVAGGIAIDHNKLAGSGTAGPPNGILFQGVASYTGVTITGNLITGFDNGINAVADPGTADQPPLGTVALPDGASVMASANCIAGNATFGATNDGPAIINAAQNWWGAASGPNTPGADSVGANVDTSNYLTRPAAICAGMHLGRGAGNSGNGHNQGAQAGNAQGRFHLVEQ